MVAGGDIFEQWKLPSALVLRVEGGREGGKDVGVPVKRGCFLMRPFFQQGSAHVLPVPQSTTYSQPRFFSFSEFPENSSTEDRNNS